MATWHVPSQHSHSCGSSIMDRSSIFDQIATRAFDIVVSLCALIFFLPLFLGVAVLVMISSGAPVFYAQRRIGRGGREFPCFKFRSMVRDADERLAEYLATNPEAMIEWNRDHKLRNDPRITVVGRFLRKSSIDELPQLLNVLFGDMSIVGPRPIVMAEVQRYGRYFNDYCSVNPGITGLWQISGRNDVSYRRRVALDTCYARQRSFLFDVNITIKTIPAVLMAAGSY